MSHLHDAVIDRLATAGHADTSWALTILAALDGDATLTSFLESGAHGTAPMAAPSPTSQADRREPPGVFVSSVSVTGFRGIGSAATLSLKPGPGLTLVVGRNGSGKSSFAEALECLFTGTSYRWEG